MSSNYQKINQSYQDLHSSFAKHKEEVLRFFDVFRQSFKDYLGCTDEKIILVNQKGIPVSDIRDAVYLSNGVPPWTLWFAIQLEKTIDSNIFPMQFNFGKFGVRINGRKSEGDWKVKVEGFEQDFLIPFDEQADEQNYLVYPNQDSFNEINKFICEQIQEDLQSYFSKFLTYGQESENKGNFGFAITPSEGEN